MSKSRTGLRLADVKLTYTTLAEEVRATNPRPRTFCAVCAHSRRAEIEECLRQRLPLTAISRTLKRAVSEASLGRHRSNHMEAK